MTNNEEIINNSEWDWREEHGAYCYWAEQQGLDHNESSTEDIFSEECEKEDSFLFDCIKEWRKHCLEKQSAKHYSK